MEDKPTLIYLRESAKLVRQFIGKSLQNAGIEEIGAQEAHILFYLMKHEQASSSDLREAQCVSKASISDALSNLVERGYIEYVSSDVDRREKRIVLTPKGRAHQNHVGEVIKEAEKALIQGVSPEDEAALRKALIQIIENAKGGNYD